MLTKLREGRKNKYYAGVFPEPKWSYTITFILSSPTHLGSHLASIHFSPEKVHLHLILLWLHLFTWIYCCWSKIYQEGRCSLFLTNFRSWQRRSRWLDLFLVMIILHISSVFWRFLFWWWNGWEVSTFRNLFREFVCVLSWNLLFCKASVLLLTILGEKNRLLSFGGLRSRFVRLLSCFVLNCLSTFLELRRHMLCWGKKVTK